MHGLPVNSLNSIEGPLSALGVMGCFRLREACGGERGLGEEEGDSKGGPGLQSLPWQVPRGVEGKAVAPLVGDTRPLEGKRRRSDRNLGLRRPPWVGTAGVPGPG